jgi:hypothetical protein
MWQNFRCRIEEEGRDSSLIAPAIAAVILYLVCSLLLGYVLIVKNHTICWEPATLGF